jgi:thymidylate synthase
MRFDFSFRSEYIRATTLEDAWISCMRKVIERGKKYIVSKTGSHGGDYRLYLDCLTGVALYPEQRPIIPMSERPGLVMPTDMNSVQEYFDTKIFSPTPPAPDEHYNYSEWLYPNTMDAIELYTREAEAGFGTAHVALRVGDPFCLRDYLAPPEYLIDKRTGEKVLNEAKRPTTPCLLGIDTSIRQGLDPEEWFLIFYVMYRSWDLFGGFPENMAGIQLLKERLASEISAATGKNVKPGPSVFFCKDLHLYGSRIEAAKAWMGIEE